MAKAKFQKKLADINSYYATGVPYIDANQGRLNVSVANNDALQLMYDNPATGKGWIQLWTLTVTPATATKPLRKERDLLRDVITNHLRVIYDDIPESVLTETDRSTLRLFKRDDKPSKRGKITTAPDVAFTPLEGGEVRQRLRYDTDNNRASIHPLADGWERVSKIGGAPPADASECPVTVSGTDALSTFNAGQENDGKRLYSFVRWINLSNPANNSAWSSMKVVTISAGTVGS